jgi:hypothetical protein
MARNVLMVTTMATTAEIHRDAVRMGYLVQSYLIPGKGPRYEVKCVHSGEVLRPGFATRAAAWEWAYDMVRAGKTSLVVANGNR